MALLDADIGPHGQPMSEATDRRADPSSPGGWHYEANDLPKTDFAAQAVASKQDAYYKKWPDVDRSAHLWQARRVDD